MTLNWEEPQAYTQEMLRKYLPAYSPHYSALVGSWLGKTQQEISSAMRTGELKHDGAYVDPSSIVQYIVNHNLHPEPWKDKGLYSVPW